MAFLKKHRKRVILIAGVGVVIFFIAGFAFLQNNRPKAPIIIYKTTLPSKRQAKVENPEHPKTEHFGSDSGAETDAPTTDDTHAQNSVASDRDVLSEDDTDLTALTDVWDTPIEAEVPEPVDFKTTPDGYPMTPYWDYPEDEQNDWSYENKLIDHVLVKLWQEGTRDFIGGSIEQGSNRVRPHYRNTLYVEWEEVEHPDGSMVKIITRALGAGDVNWQQKGPFDLPPPEVHLIDINSTQGKGIDPFTFLTSEELPK